MSFSSYILQSHRFLDHARSPDAPQDGPNTGKAAVTKEGFCIEYRESLQNHFDRYAAVWKKEPLGVFEIGIERGIYMTALYWTGV